MHLALFLCGDRAITIQLTVSYSVAQDIMWRSEPKGNDPTPIAVRQRHIIWLEVAQELHQFHVVLPVFFGGRSTHFTRWERLSLHFQVHFRKEICRVERNMPQPGTNVPDIGCFRAPQRLDSNHAHSRPVVLYDLRLAIRHRNHLARR